MKQWRSSTVDEFPTATPEFRSEEPRPPKRRRWWRWIAAAVLLLLIAGAYVVYRRLQNAAAGAEARRAQQPQVINVVAARAHRGNIGVYVDGLGSVIPIFTVTVNSRVDGQLMQVLFSEGQMVHQGDLLAEIDPRPFQAQLTQFEGALVRDQALLENARVDLNRYRILLTREAVPEQTYATQQSLVKQFEGNVKTDQGQIESAKLNIYYSRITAPVTGRVGLRLVDPGNIVTANVSALLVITQISPISVIFTIGEDQLVDVRKKLQAGASLTVDAYDRLMKDKLAQGRLETIDNQIDPTTGTVRLRATFDNTNGALFPNQFVNARLLLEERRNVTLIANAAIQRNAT